MNHVASRVSSMVSICMHYDEIVHFPISDEDLLTSMLIDYYRDFIATVNSKSLEEVRLLSHYDQALFYYLTNHQFYKLVQQYYEMESDWGNYLMENLVDLYENKKETELLKKETVWI